MKASNGSSVKAQKKKKESKMICHFVSARLRSRLNPIKKKMTLVGQLILCFTEKLLAANYVTKRNERFVYY